ncbi:hypothetical protein KTJ89_11485 [Brevibacterium sediminis]|uniref:hypothetical protein n=1 Tax=Brevibacterium sediminis TaxID=1857024 RepID=UPI00217541A6|nr:hypothetical protein [Brevibacterium sediminis]MCS4593601.1 hypothetical protein [Brevibacterium sediminis]
MSETKRGFGTRGAFSIMAALAVTAVITTVIAAPGGVDAAPNPLRDKTAEHTVSIAADGSYSVRMDTKLDLALETAWGFGGDIHDGFRLPDSESLLPPYLRAHYSNPQGTIDSAPAEATIESELHSVDIGFSTDRLAAGSHRGVLNYEVAGAAVPAADMNGDQDNGVVVYVRPLDRGDLVIESAAPISAVDCEVFSPRGESCGEKTGDSWTVPAEDLLHDRAVIDAVRITIDADPKGVPAPDIDS